MSVIDPVVLYTRMDVPQTPNTVSTQMLPSKSPIVANQKSTEQEACPCEGQLVHADVLEPVRTAVVLVQPSLAVGESPGDAALALGRVGAVEEGNVLVPNVAEPVAGQLWSLAYMSLRHLPVDLGLVLEETQGNAVHRSISPSLVEETSGTVQVVEIILVSLAAPKVDVCNLKVTPEVAG